MTLLNIMILEF